MFRKGIALMLALVSLLACVTTARAEDRVGYVTSTGLYIRKSPNTSADALRCATNGEQLIILKEEGDWYYVKYNSVVSGYVAKKFVSTTKPSTSSGTTSSTSGGSTSGGSADALPSTVAELGKAPASSKRGDRGNDVKKLQQALKILGYYSGSCDGVFGEQTEKSVMRFQDAKGLTQDGVAGKVTITLLFGEEPSGTSSTLSISTGNISSGGGGGSTEMVDWFSGGNNIIPRGARFTIKDVRSGVTMKVQHLFGANHLDAEPVDSNETAKLKQVYGGEWSWNRRPILVSYNGRVIAASMNGMPHGEQSIYDNDFDGQFCIHFVNSKTHGSGNVDADHQACISEAAKASW